MRTDTAQFHSQQLKEAFTPACALRMPSRRASRRYGAAEGAGSCITKLSCTSCAVRLTRHHASLVATSSTPPRSHRPVPLPAAPFSI